MAIHLRVITLAERGGWYQGMENKRQGEVIWIVYGAEFLQEGHAWLESLLYNSSRLC